MCCTSMRKRYYTFYVDLRFSCRERYLEFDLTETKGITMLPLSQGERKWRQSRMKYANDKCIFATKCERLLMYVHGEYWKEEGNRREK